MPQGGIDCARDFRNSPCPKELVSHKAITHGKVKEIEKPDCSQVST